MSTKNQALTVRDALIDLLRGAANFNAVAELAPLAVLWPDEMAQWPSTVRALRRQEMPILTLGEFDLEERTGPAIWIRAELANWSDPSQTPIVYLPGVGRDAFRNMEEAPADIQPLLFLQYRGALFLQPNGKDWTISAFLQNAQHGLGIKVDAGRATQSALIGASEALLARTVSELRQHPGGVDADFLNGLLISDMPKRILEWINDPATTRGALDDASWSAFSTQLQTKYKVNPDRDGPSVAARQLGSAVAGSYWLDVWNRFAESPGSYPGIPAMLRGAKPGEAGQRGLFGSAESNYHWPQDNEEQENALRAALVALETRPEAAAREAIIELEQVHAPRRASVWARLNQAPLAFAIEQLSVVARETATPFPAGSVETMRRRYSESGWRIDAAALAAQAAVGNDADLNAVNAVLHALYTPWLWTTAERFQEVIAGQAVGSVEPATSVAPGTCLLFADGLRYDLGARLQELLQQDGFTATIAGSLGPLPGVTPSAKPAQSPVAGQLLPGPKLNVVATAGGSPVTQGTLKKLLLDAGWNYLGPGETGAPDGLGKAWTELGSIDSYGHNHPENLAKQAFEELRRITQRVSSLLQAGWPRVAVVTDHGWLLTPRPMPKTDLPQHLTVERKGRCARLLAGSTTALQTVPWHWDAGVRIAMAPGISCFEDGKRYEHGGLSLQECIVPTIVVSKGASAPVSATIKTVTWKSLRCQVEVAGAASGCYVDIRQKAADASTSIAVKAQAIDGKGIARVLVGDDMYEETPAIVVVVNGQGQVLAQQATIVGGAEQGG